MLTLRCAPGKRKNKLRALFEAAAGPCQANGWKGTGVEWQALVPVMKKQARQIEAKQIRGESTNGEYESVKGMNYPTFKATLIGKIKG